MIVIRYDLNKTHIEDVVETFKMIKSQTKEDVICIPKDFDVLWDIGVNDLIKFRDIINEYINKMQTEGAVPNEM